MRAQSGDKSYRGLQMLLKSLRLPFQHNATVWRLGGYESTSAAVRPEIEKELEQVRRELASIADRAAFSLETIENGEGSGRMSAEVESLTRKLDAMRQRQRVLERQLSFLSGTNAGLSDDFRGHGR
jgi:cell division protein FtsB